MAKKKEQTKIIRLLGGLIAVVLVVGFFSALYDASIEVKPSRLVSRIKRVWSEDAEEINETGEVDYNSLVNEVVPASGRTVLVEWGEMGKRLIDAGAIDLAKFEERYSGLSEEQKEVLQGDDLRQITFTADNIQFWTNVLWSLGLTQESKVLSEGPMKQREEEIPIAQYAGTAGWTLGSKEAMQLYNSSRLVDLTVEQDELVYKVAENIFRPCCGNNTAFPDCNHGMAVLGLLELMASQGADEEAMYRAALAFNSYAFPSTYVTAAAHFGEQGVSWGNISAFEVLGAEFSSAQGAQFIASQVGEIPGAPKQGGGCGA